LLISTATTFRGAGDSATGSLPEAVAVGDFNGDGVLDLAVVFSGGVHVLVGNGDGTFQPIWTTGVSYIAGSYPYSIAVGDFNGDGWPDLAVANIDSNDVSILLNDGVWSRPHPGDASGTGRRDNVPRSDPAPLVEGSASRLIALLPRSTSMAPSETIEADPARLISGIGMSRGGMVWTPGDSARPFQSARLLSAVMSEGRPLSSAGADARARAERAPRWLLDDVFADAEGIWTWGTDACGFWR
jgi:hypothetical protein